MGRDRTQGGLNWSTYKWCNGSETTFTKYCTNSSYGTVDNKTELDPEDDAAYVNWGPSWRMPTMDQLQELTNKCTWNWTTQNGVNGLLITGPNGNSMFLPAGGRIEGSSMKAVMTCGYYWGQMLSGQGTAIDLECISAYPIPVCYERCTGLNVRAVRVQ